MKVKVFGYDEATDSIYLYDQDNEGVLVGGPVSGPNGVIIDSRTKCGMSRGDQDNAPPEFTDPLGP